MQLRGRVLSWHADGPASSLLKRLFASSPPQPKTLFEVVATPQCLPYFYLIFKVMSFIFIFIMHCTLLTVTALIILSPRPLPLILS